MEVSSLPPHGFFKLNSSHQTWLPEPVSELSCRPSFLVHVISHVYTALECFSCAERGCTTRKLAQFIKCHAFNETPSQAQHPQLTALIPGEKSVCP